jgi:hypothetical protein
MVGPSGTFAPGIGQDQRAIPDHSQEHRPLKSRETQQWQGHALQDAERVEVHGNGDAQRQTTCSETPRRLCSRLEDDRPRAVHALDELRHQLVFVGVAFCLHDRAFLLRHSTGTRDDREG